MSPLDQAYSLGSDQAERDFAKIAWAWVGKAISNPTTSGAAMGAVTGAMAGGQDNRMLGALAGAGLGALGGRSSLRNYPKGHSFQGPAMKPGSAPGVSNLQTQNLAGQSSAIATGGVLGGVVGGGTMNMVGLGDRPKSMVQRYAPRISRSFYG
jgi:hypothetical protein